MGRSELAQGAPGGSKESCRAAFAQSCAAGPPGMPALAYRSFRSSKIDPVKLYISCVPIERVSDKFDDVILLPSLENERTGTDVVTWARPLGIALVHST